MYYTFHISVTVFSISAAKIGKISETSMKWLFFFCLSYIKKSYTACDSKASKIFIEEQKMKDGIIIGI